MSSQVECTLSMIVVAMNVTEAGIMEKVDPDDISPMWKPHSLAYHLLIRITSQIRVVFDAAAKIGNCTSINN